MRCPSPPTSPPLTPTLPLSPQSHHHHLSSVSTGYTLHAFITKLGFASNPHILTALFLYSSLDDYKSAHQLFDKCLERNKSKIATWNSLISGLIKSGNSQGAIGLFYRLLKVRRVEPGEVTVVGALTACTDIGALDATRWVHEHAMRSMVDVNVYVGTALIDAYAKCGCIEMVRKVFGEMRERNVRSWTAMICGLLCLGHGDEVVSLFEEMVNEGFETFTAVLSACCHFGLVDKGRRVFSNMVSVFRIVPRIEHYGFMIVMFSRAGLLDEALGLIESMLMKTDAALYMGFVVECLSRNPSNLKLAKYVTDHFMKTDNGKLRTWMKARGQAKNIRGFPLH